MLLSLSIHRTLVFIPKINEYEYAIQIRRKKKCNRPEHNQENTEKEKKQRKLNKIIIK